MKYYLNVVSVYNKHVNTTGTCVSYIIHNNEYHIRITLFPDKKYSLKEIRQFLKFRYVQPSLSFLHHYTIRIKPWIE